MNKHQCIVAAQEIDRAHLAPICGTVQQDPQGRSVRHLRWMVQQICGDMPQDKAMRWLGYIQGALVWGCGVHLETMKRVSAKASQEQRPVCPDCLAAQGLCVACTEIVDAFARGSMVG
jgi:hypothetical protein